MSPLASGRSPFPAISAKHQHHPATSATHWHACWGGAQPRYVGDPVSSSGSVMRLMKVGWFLVAVDPAEVPEIGRASCRERVWVAGVEGSLAERRQARMRASRMQ